ncbi:MAG: DegV family protein [Clostridia bacterium]|nr:DegV family protein [Clostridia bacterium]
MKNNFLLSCESTVDLPFSYVSGRNIEVLFYTYSVDGVEYDDDMGRDPAALDRFYGFMKDGKFPATSQINIYKYTDYFESLLRLYSGDILHIAMGSGMSPSVNNAVDAAAALKEKYPDRTIKVIDSLCSCGGYGILVDLAADLRDEGKSFEDTVNWLEDNKSRIHHQFFSTDLKYFRRSGRVSGTTATVATILGICPIMHLNSTGHIIAYDKVRGKRKAIKTTVDTMLADVEEGTEYNGKCVLCHSNCIEEAEETVKLIKQTFPKLKDVMLSNIGTIIASHAGPGTVALFFVGKPRVGLN